MDKAHYIIGPARLTVHRMKNAQSTFISYIYTLYNSVRFSAAFHSFGSLYDVRTLELLYYTRVFLVKTADVIIYFVPM
jgi:hypothetical protein